MTAKVVQITVTFHPVPPGGDSDYSWSVVVDGVTAHGHESTQRGALQAARRRVRKIQKLRNTLDVQSLIDCEQAST